MPSKMDNMRERVQGDKQLPARDLDINTAFVYRDDYDMAVNNPDRRFDHKSFEVQQVEFSILNPNYLLVLSNKNNFMCYNLAVSGLACEQELDLQNMVSEHRYGYLNKNLKMVSFAQAHPKTVEFYGLDIF